MSEKQIPVDYGPLTNLIGNWQGDKGLDVAPEPKGSETHPYYESIFFEAIGDVTNAEEQTLAVVHYRQIVTRKIDDEVFHDETGYWMWDEVSQTVMHSLTIPRGLALLAGGQYSSSGQNAEIVLEVSAKIDDPDWSIVQSPFMQDKAKTIAFKHEVVIGKDKLRYAETTTLDIYGRIFEHTDTNELTRC
jgi:hypothetical protein